MQMTLSFLLVSLSDICHRISLMHWSFNLCWWQHYRQLQRRPKERLKMTDSNPETLKMAINYYVSMTFCFRPACCMFVKEKVVHFKWRRYCRIRILLVFLFLGFFLFSFSKYQWHKLQTDTTCVQWHDVERFPFVLECRCSRVHESREQSCRWAEAFDQNEKHQSWSSSCFCSLCHSSSSSSVVVSNTETVSHSRCTHGPPTARRQLRPAAVRWHTLAFLSVMVCPPCVWSQLNAASCCTLRSFRWHIYQHVTLTLRTGSAPDLKL